MKKGNLQSTMAIIILALGLMSVFLYIFGGKIVGHFLSQDYGEGACDMAMKQSESLKFKNPVNEIQALALTVIGGAAGCVIGGAVGILGIFTGPGVVATVVAGCTLGAAGGTVVGATVGASLETIPDVDVIGQSGILAKCGASLPMITGTKSQLTVALANASVWGCEFSKLDKKDRATIIRSMPVNVTDADIGFNDVKAQMDSIYAGYGVPAENRCYLLWRINDTKIDCGEFRLYSDLPPESEKAAGVLKAGEPAGIRINYCRDRFMRTNKSFISIIGNVTT